MVFGLANRSTYSVNKPKRRRREPNAYSLVIESTKPKKRRRGSHWPALGHAQEVESNDYSLVIVSTKPKWRRLEPDSLVG